MERVSEEQDLINRIQHEIWDYEARTGTAPDRIVASYPIVHMLKAILEREMMVYRTEDNKSEYTLYGIKLDVVPIYEPYFMVGKAVTFNER